MLDILDDIVLNIERSTVVNESFIENDGEFSGVSLVLGNGPVVVGLCILKLTFDGSEEHIEW